jgi:hypothetical protein
MRWAALLLLLPLLTGNALAHGGEDHDEAAAPAAWRSRPGRRERRERGLRVVAVVQGGQLLIYLDRFATNEPVAGATIEIESGAFKAVANAVAPGLYTVAGDVFKTSGRYPLTITIETDAKSGGVSDLLSATLEVAPQATADAAPAKPWPGIAGLGPATLALLAAAAVVLLTVGASVLRRRLPRGQTKGSIQ